MLRPRAAAADRRAPHSGAKELAAAASRGILSAAASRRNSRRFRTVVPIRFPLILSMLALLPAATCGSAFHLPARAQRTVAVDVPLPEDTSQLELQFHDGLLTLQPGDAPTCRLQIHLVADDEAALAALASGVAPQLTRDGTTTRLQLAMPVGAPLDSVRSSWHVAAPRQVRVTATTRRGAVVARNVAFDLEVRGGSGVVEAQMAGGAARLSSSSGSLILRGDYPFADVHSELGRIDLCLPALDRSSVDVRASSRKGDIYVDLRKGQRIDLLYFGDERLVHCDPEVRVQWLRNTLVDGNDYLEGCVGDLSGQCNGQLRLHADSQVHMRLRPDGAVAGTR